MKKVIISFAIVAAGLFVASCGNKSEANAEGTDSSENTEVAAQVVKEGDMGPCTVSCEKFSIDIPEGWQVRVLSDKEISAGKEYHEGLDFVYEDQANYAQEQQIKMDKNGMQDLGEKTYGDNTYATFLWKQDSGDDFSAILKIGDGEAGVIKVNTTNVKTADNEVVLKVLESLKMK